MVIDSNRVPEPHILLIGDSLITDRHHWPRYLHYLLAAIRSLPKEPEGDFYRGVGPDAVPVTLPSPAPPAAMPLHPCPQGAAWNRVLCGGGGDASTE